MIRTGGYYIASGRVVKITELYKGYFTDDNHVEYEADELAEVGLLKDIFERNGYKPRYEPGGVVYLKEFKNGGEIRAKYEGGCLYPKISIRNGVNIFLGVVSSYNVFCDILSACGYKEDFRCV